VRLLVRFLRVTLLAGAGSAAGVLLLAGGCARLGRGHLRDAVGRVLVPIHDPMTTASTTSADTGT